MNIADFLYYKKLPQVYRDMDSEVNYAFKRYLQALSEGGFDIALADTQSLSTLVDPLTCPDQFFPRLCESFGIPYFSDIKIEYQRKLLSNFGEVMRRKGTYSCIKYIVKLLTSLEVELTYTTEYEGNEGKFLIVTIISNDVSDITGMDTKIAVMQRYVKYFIPYYVDAYIISTVTGTVIQSSIYYLGNAITSFRSYNLGSAQ